MRRKTWKLNRLTAVAALWVAGFASMHGAMVTSVAAQDRASGADATSPSTAVAPAAPQAAKPTTVVRCRELQPQASPANSTFAVYASDGTRVVRSLKLTQSFANPKEAVSKSLELRKSCSSPCVVEWRGGQQPAEHFHPAMRTLKIESCSVYTMTCSRTGWLATKKNLTPKDAEAWADAHRPEYLRVEVVYHVAAQ